MTDDSSNEISILDRLLDCVHAGIKWSSEQLKSACPKKPKKRCTEEDTDIGPPCTEKRSYIPPSQICPKPVSCCYIKMQDPYSPCCCEITKPQPPPCPPKCHRSYREPVCGCDLCKKKHPLNRKCCDHGFSRSTQ